ncbi:MAG: zinc ABC transporter substrate-binding protein [Candidatus Omnitrophica bacterium]|nr:zinc ABC transporter substrate-binding protein [Candidatus Omnitrophota bacterium]
MNTQTKVVQRRERMNGVMVVGMLCGWLVSQPGLMAAPQKLKVVATLSTFADLAQTIGAEHIEVSAIASPRFNPHFIEPKPSDVMKVKQADLVIHAGLDLELWRGPLLDAAGNTKAFPGGPGELDLSYGIELLEVPTHPLSRLQGDIHLYGNPHYWLNPQNAKIMAETIAEKLAALDPDHARDFQQNLQAFLKRLDEKIPTWQAALAPYHGRELIGDHRAWPYLMTFLGLKMEQHLEPKPGIPPTPKQVAFLERYISEQRVAAIVKATYFPPQTPEAIARRTGAKVVSLCQSVREQPACSDYIAMLDYNVAQLSEVLNHG